MAKLGKTLSDKIDELKHDDDAAKAAAGRLMGPLTETIRAWMDGEEDRGTDIADICIALSKALTIQVSAYALTIAKPDHREQALKVMADSVHSDMSNFADSDDIHDKFDAFMAKKTGH